MAAYPVWEKDVAWGRNHGPFGIKMILIFRGSGAGIMTVCLGESPRYARARSGCCPCDSQAQKACTRSRFCITLRAMTLTQLNAFVLVARLGSVTAAANALGVSESAVSQALSA